MAEPLSILGGVAASIQLIECATDTLVGTIKLIRDLREIPRKTATCLEDVERSSERVNYVCRDILGAGSLAADCIEPGVVGRLSNSCYGLRLAIDDAGAALRPVLEGLDSSKHKAAYRLWNTVVTKTRESSILEKLQRLDKLNLELIGDFNIANLTVQLQLGSSLKENSVVTQRHRLESAEGFNNLIESSAESQSALMSMVNKTDHWTSDVLDLAETARSIHHDTAQFGSEMQKQFRLSHDDMERMMRYHETRMSTELRSIRDELIVAISAAENGSSTKPVELGLAHLATQDEALLQSGIALSLMQKPNLLRDAWRMSHRNASLFESCSCRPKTKTSSSRVWNIQFSSLQRDDHRKECHFHRSGSHSWAYSFSANLRPFLDRVVDISLGAITGPGTWTMFPPLRFCRIVQRSKSPVFSAFDRIVKLCTERKPPVFKSGIGRRYHWADNYSDSKHGRELDFELEWLPSTGEQLKVLNTLIRNEIRQGKFSGIETDENGFTILFEFCSLVTLLGRQWNHFGTQLRCLLRTIIQSQVDVLATTTFDERLRQYRIGNFWSSRWEEQVTAVEYFLERGYSWAVVLGQEIPFYDVLLREGVIDGLESVSRSSSDFRSMAPHLLIQHVEVAKALQYDDLALAIIRRSIDDVSFLASKALLDGTTKPLCSSKHTYMELALGWPAGIHFLLSKGFTVAPAIASACRSKDVSSLKILLNSKEAIFTINLDFDSSWSHCVASAFWTLREAINSGSREILFLMLLELKKRKERLCDNKSEINSEDEAHREDPIAVLFLGNLTSSKLADICCVRGRHDGCETMSPYHFQVTDQDFKDRRSSLRGYADVLDTIYSSGFTNIDQVDEAKETPMFRHVRRAFRSTRRSDIAFYEGDIIEWFLAHGANVINQTEEGWPNILFYLAFCGSIHLPSWEIDEWGGEKAKTVLERLQVSSDMCKCFCTLSGCLPVHLVLRCYHSSRRGCVHATGRAELLRQWMRRWDVLPDEKEILTMEMVRLELFERLGMAHTCCRHGWRKSRFSGSPFTVDCLPESEVQSIRDDDSELNAQLEVFLAHYKLWKLEARTSDTLADIWWNTVDEILPPLTPDECHQRHQMSVWDLAFMRSDSVVMRDPETSRGDRETEALRKSGFESVSDFKEVIEIHLSRRKVGLLKRRNA